MAIFNKIYLWILAQRSPVKYARKIGVKVGRNTKITNVRYGGFGSEPYLISIGDDCLISGEVKFLTHDGSLHVFRKEYPKAFIYNPVVVGNNVFIGYRSIIMPGVKIGNNVVIGAGSLVAQDVPDNCVVAGVPAKILKSIEAYKEKMVPKFDQIDGLNKVEREKYLKNKFGI